MSLKKNLQRLAPVVFAGMTVLGMPSCEKDPVIADEFEVVTPGDVSASPEVVVVTAPTTIIGNVGELEAELKKSFTNIVDVKNAKIILVESSVINDNEELLSDAYDKGVLIAVFNPDGYIVSEWSDKNDIFYAGPDVNEKWSIYGFNNRGTYYIMHKPSDDIGDEGVPLFHFCNWVNAESALNLRGVDLRSNNIKKRFTSQSVTHTFNLSVEEKQLIEERWASPGQLNLSTTANVKYVIYPIHVFDAGVNGDYYAVEAEMVLHNAPMNNGSWVRRHGNDEAKFQGLFMSRCDVTANLLRKSNGNISESVSHVFANGADPHPASTEDAVVYNSGFDWTLGATVSGGIPDSKDNHKLTAFNNWTWNNLADCSLSGIAIKNIGNSSNVKYTLSLMDQEGNKEGGNVPEVASGDLVFKYSWIWRVSDIDETSNDILYMQVDVNPVYMAYQLNNSGNKVIKGEFANSVSKTAFKFPIVPPNRVPTGSAVISNTSKESYYIRDIKLWRNKTTDKEPDLVVPQTICTPTATGGSGVSATMLIIPAGEYIIQGVRYSVEDGKPVGEQIIRNTTPIKIGVGGTHTIDFGSDIFTVM